jgi:two-component system response regulator MprA
MLTDSTSEQVKKSVLVADDNVDLLEAMADALEMDGYSVLRAHNGREALELAADDSVCLILLDLSMPVMDGWEFLEQRKRIPRLAAIPVIVLSAYAWPKPSDAEGVLQKPVTLDTIRRLVRCYC